MTIANPIYDSVFKFLMEDERVARTILSALLKMNLTKVEVRPHEYSNTGRDKISMFRIDFGATVLKEDGTEQLILVEVQKTWVETETLRFRQYLGVQYQRKENIVAESKDGHALPMIAVYILGHKVGDIEEPVIYVRHKAYDYDENPIEKGMPDPFVESLTHDSIIVQIPRLRKHINRPASGRLEVKNRLDTVLSIFDQSQQDSQTQQLLNVDATAYKDDNEMQPILHRLLMAASDADTRMDMNVEDEYYSIIEKRDTVILQMDHEIAEKSLQLAQQNAQIKEQSERLEQKNQQLQEQNAMLRSSIKLFLNSGYSMQQIADTLGKDIATIQQLTEEQSS